MSSAILKFNVNQSSKLIFLLLVAAAWSTFLVGCGGGDDDADTGTDSDTDGDTDNDSDSDTDTEYDTEKNDMISDVTVKVHDKVNTILVVTWTQDKEADEVWLKYTFENDEWYESPKRSGETGEHSELILGIPGETDVTLNVMAKVGNTIKISADYEGTTESVPSGMPIPTVESYDAKLAGSQRWLFGTVDDTAAPKEDYSGPFWGYIIDRMGRIVWYFSDLANGPIMNFSRISRDSTYVLFNSRRWDKNPVGIYQMTLDHSFYEWTDIKNMSDCFDITDDGSFLYDMHSGDKDAWLVERSSNGKVHNIWNCSANLGKIDEAACYTNTVNWNPDTNTVLMSYPEINTIAEIDRESGDVVGIYGEYGDYSIEPSSIGLEFQHFANITPDGTLMVSTHIPGKKQHAFVEFTIDRTNKILKEKWIYDEGDEWPAAMGEAHVVPGGTNNVLVNYGTAGVIREITRDKQIAWEVKFDADWSDDLYNKMVGHCQLIDDLYALIQGP